MPISPSLARRARPLAVTTTALVLALSAACRGRNEGKRGGYGDASMGAGGPGEPGPRAGWNTDTTLSPVGTPGPTRGTSTTNTEAAAKNAAAATSNTANGPGSGGPRSAPASGATKQ